MALGRNQTLVGTGLADQTPHLVRDVEADTQAAVEEKIAAYKAAGLKIPEGLSRQLKSSSRRAASDTPGDANPLGALTNVPQPMAPGTVERGTPLSPSPDTVPEPEDGSAPDKRAQDQSPVGYPPHAKDPGPEYTKQRELPVQPQPGELVVNPVAVEKARLAYEEQVTGGDEPAFSAGPTVGDETEEEAEARRKVANQQVPAPTVEPRPTPDERTEAAVNADLGDEDDTALREAPAAAKEAPAKRAPAKKAPAKKATARRGR